MKNALVILLLCLASNTNAQETIARFKYEDAEKAFVAQNYQECIDNLNEAEKLLGKTAPNILHLKILAQHQLFEKDPFESYEALETLRSNCNTYLANYDIAGLEEKYRDVYDISNQLPTVSSTKEFKELGLLHTKELREASLNKAIAQNNLVFVEGSTFTMGKNGDAHEVTLSDFYIGKYEVTYAQWNAYLRSTGRGNSISKYQPSKKDGAFYMLTSYNDAWDQAMAYCKWLEKQYGGTWRLPTEAEWEYSARGGIKSQGYKYSGSDDIREVTEKTANIYRPVGLKKANELGIYDMTGNCFEICYDYWDRKYYSESPKENPMGPGEGKHRVARGGGGKMFAISNYDRWNTSLIDKVGFRVVYIPDQNNP
ncbi:formylglycine-generating enzyme family protein [Flagellimonas amoyensis]|uniref:formylglycine-generating enzyme family protein n=1 Tax=Flagellimonas amoyensis TaxID=2169401 RepID=UPI000D3C000A|nr:SUMF1/EgtB/PvdO family nonheme iron enzyme [Allomuricauda amoyensis]